MNYPAPKGSRPRKSRIFSSRIIFVTLAAFALLAIATTSAFMAPPADPNPGAIFTTDTACAGTNVNIFTSKDGVYLNGGPKHPGAAALPDGSYFVQVTDPGGATLLGKSLTADFVIFGGIPAACYRLADLVASAGSGFTTNGYDDSPNNGGEYKVWVSLDSTFANSNTKTDNFKVKATGCQDCPPPQTNPTLRVRKYYDANANGINDDAQPITGWKIHIQDNIDFIRYTPVNLVVDVDTYTVTEFPTTETNWQHTGCGVINNLLNSLSACTPGPDNTSVTLESGDDKTVEFGNLCLGAGGGLTLGYWSNKNGEAAIKNCQGGGTAATLAFLSTLNLRNGNGSAFDPASYNSNPSSTNFRSWILSATATNMAYMLSAQLAAMELNVRCGGVNGGSLIYAPGTTSANAFGYAPVNAVMAEADATLGLNGSTLSGNPERTHQEALKNALDKANNNQNFVQAGPCAFSFAP
ncbi:MAG: hypothetical protein QOG23_2558 [Blastocatellia bacterium]|jgi:hypothetical protein|nr:hypothetical protein [Blastocatellia bacterium]